MKNKAYLLPACKTADGVPIGIGSEVYAITFNCLLYTSDAADE